MVKPPSDNIVHTSPSNCNQHLKTQQVLSQLPIQSELDVNLLAI